MPEDLEDILRTVATDVYERVKHQSFTDRIFEKEISLELTELEIPHEAHKKVYDERKGKYKFIDLWFPDHKCFVKIKARKYITRTELNELKDEENMTEMEGIIINFYNGVIFRHTNSGRGRSSNTDFDSLSSLSMPPEHHRHNKPRMTLPQLSGSTGRLSDISDPNFRHNKLQYNRSPLSALPLNGERDSFQNANKIFSLSCAAFFLAEGNRKEFSSIFNDLLEGMKFDRVEIPNSFLEGPNLKTPDGELSDVLQKAFAERRRSKSKKDRPDRSAQSSQSSRKQSAEVVANVEEPVQEPVQEAVQEPLHYVGFNDTEQQ